MNTKELDVLIVGAGLSGIGMACHLIRDCKDKRFAILERRSNMGGTWDLFRYPGIRSDSDMFTFGYNFRPWTERKFLADGESIRHYIQDTAAEYGVDKKIQYGRKVVRANFSTETNRWTVDVLREDSGESESYTAKFFINCTGYYNYDKGYQPDYPGLDSYKGQLIHPQQWPEDLDYKGKRVVVIGSGATAVTLVPSMADETAHITMLQRSPTYMVPVPAIDPVTAKLQKILPSMVVYRLTRARNVALHRFIYEASRSRPGAMRRLLLGIVRKQLGGAVEMRHFTPHYNPWDQRLCAVSDGDLFKVLRSGKASIETDHIETFTEKGIKLKSGKELEADIIISATGLDVQMLGGAELQVDGKPKVIKDVVVYKNAMLEGVPNMGLVFGYTNLSWTLKADIASEYLCRVINHMDRYGSEKVVAIDKEGVATDDTIMGSLSAGYVKRAADRLPRAGAKAPWGNKQDYFFDAKMLRFDPVDDGILQFEGASSRTASGSGVRRVLGQIRDVLPSRA